MSDFDTFRKLHGISPYRLLLRLYRSRREKIARKTHGIHIKAVCLKQNVKSGSVSTHVMDISCKQIWSLLVDGNSDDDRLVKNYKIKTKNVMKA